MIKKMLPLLFLLVLTGCTATRIARWESANVLYGLSKEQTINVMMDKEPLPLPRWIHNFIYDINASLVGKFPLLAWMP
ncbi:hypothetical protein LCGC14_2140870 [marine sediment metagenome]|uniref:Lipoprotein n=1 Tax=marine sediment metagenome TaxID=412755 RepID=A0A0F9DYE6_9ZZZZ